MYDYYSVLPNFMSTIETIVIPSSVPRLSKCIENYVFEAGIAFAYSCEPRLRIETPKMGDVVLFIKLRYILRRLAGSLGIMSRGMCRLCIAAEY